MTRPTVPCRSCGSSNRIEPMRVRRGQEPVCGRCEAPLAVSAAPEEVTDQSFDEQVLGSPRPVLLDVWAPWCVPCRSLQPVLEELASSLVGRVRVIKLNSDTNPATAARLRIQGIPTLVIYKDGREVTRMIGVRGQDELEEKLEHVLPASAV